jgi:multiple sugar transport system substrate-binding protein
MKTTANQTPALPRRAVLTGLGAAGMTMAQGAFAAGGVPVGASNEVHHQIAQTAKTQFAKTTQELSILFPRGAGANLRPVVQAFQQMTGIKGNMIEVDIDMVSSDLMLDAMVGGGRYDIALPATFALPDLMAAQAIVPMDKWHSRFANFRESRQPLYEIGDTYQGQRYGFQTDGDSYLLFLNANFLNDPTHQKRYEDQTGTSLSAPKTWEELDQQMAFFHAADGSRFGGNLFRIPGYQTWEWWLRFHAKGLWPFAEDMGAQISGQAGISTLEDMIRASEYLPPSAFQEGVFGNADRFAKGDIYCTLGWGGSQKRLNAPTSPMRGQMAFVQPPGAVIEGQAVSAAHFNWGWSYVISASSQCQALGYLFSLFATTPAISTLAVRQVEGFFDPFLAEHYNDAGIIKAYSKPFLRAQRAGLEQAIPDLYMRGQTLYLQALGSNIDLALNGMVTPEAALKQAAREWELITTRIGRDAQIDSWHHLKTQYPPLYQTHLKDLPNRFVQGVHGSN